jgi:hypothetical protein
VDWDTSDAAPDTDIVTDQMWSIPVDRITLDGVAQVQLAARQSAAPERRACFAQGTFENLRDPADRLYFKQVKAGEAQVRSHDLRLGAISLLGERRPEAEPQPIEPTRPGDVIVDGEIERALVGERLPGRGIPAPAP